MKINCFQGVCDHELWRIAKGTWWGSGLSGPEGCHAVSSTVSKVQAKMPRLAFPGDRLQTLGSLRRVEGAGMERSSVRLVHKFATTPSNTMIRKRFHNDKKGFGKFGP